MSGEAVFVHDPSLEDYGFGEDHPFRPVRIRTTIELCESLGLLEGYPFVESETATDEDLTTVHYTSYVNRVKKAGRGKGDLGEDELEELKQYGIGIQDNPIFEGMHEASAHVVGATIRACRLAMNGEAEHALCPSGGLQRRATLLTHCFLALPDASSASNPGFLRSVLESMFRGGGSTALTTAVHHAQRWAASGFCVYNDVGVAIARLKEEHPDTKIAYVDTDVHHADGVRWMF